MKMPIPQHCATGDCSTLLNLAFVGIALAISLPGCAITQEQRWARDDARYAKDDALAENLVSADPETRASAEASLGERKTLFISTLIPAKWIDALRKGDQQRASRAVEALAKAEPPGSKLMLAAVPAKPEEAADILSGATVAMIRIGPPAIPDLIDTLSYAIEERDRLDTKIDTNPRATIATVALIKMGASAVPILVQYLDDKAPKPADDRRRTPQAVIYALEMIGPPAQAAIPSLIRAIRTDETRDAAAAALWRTGPRGISLLVQALSTKSDKIRASATAVLQEHEKTMEFERLDAATLAKVKQALNKERARQERAMQKEAHELLNAGFECMAAETMLGFARQAASQYQYAASQPPEKLAVDLQKAGTDYGEKCGGFWPRFYAFQQSGAEGRKSLYQRCLASIEMKGHQGQQVLEKMCSDFFQWVSAHQR
ncbi:MAG: hypothetical protein HZB91_03575 [Elusimicrobia bacterium]|nr:hypothetical protein [Elusimicrobiota bacterium]